MKHTLALFGSAFLLAGCSETEKPPEPRPVAWVEVGASETTSDDQVTFPARVRAEQRASLSFEVGGTLTSVRAEIGDRVGRGAVVATLDSATYRFNAASADAQVVETRARLARARQEAERQRALFAEGDEEPRPQSATYAIPLTAIMPTGPDRGEVWVVDTQTDKVSARTIRFEAASENRVTVTSGLKSGDVVVSKGAAFLQTGERVSLIGAGARRFAS